MSRVRWTGSRPFDLAFAGLSGLAAVVILLLGRGATFLADETEFLDSRSLGDVSSWFFPHNEHWVTFPVLLYRGIYEILGVGRTWYVPYLVALVLLHLLVAAGVYRLLRDTTPPPLALAGATLLLFLGSGYENLFWAFQIGFVGASAAGVWALVAVRSGSVGAATALLLIAAATQGVGLAFVVSCVAYAAMTRLRRGWLLLAPLAAYGAWAILERAAFTPGMSPDPGTAIVYGIAGLAGSFGRMLGVDARIGGFGIILLVVCAIVLRRRDPLVVATGLGALVMFAALAISRAGFGIEAATWPRYVYVAAVFFVVCIGGLVGRAPRVPVVAVVMTSFALALAANLRDLVAGAAAFTAH